MKGRVMARAMAGKGPGQIRDRAESGAGRSGAAAELRRGRFQGRRGAGPRTEPVRDPGVAAAEAEQGRGLAWAGKWWGKGG
jgi:hypothetical protein